MAYVHVTYKLHVVTCWVSHICTTVKHVICVSSLVIVHLSFVFLPVCRIVSFLSDTGRPYSELDLVVVVFTQVLCATASPVVSLHFNKPVGQAEFVTG